VESYRLIERERVPDRLFEGEESVPHLMRRQIWGAGAGLAVTGVIQAVSLIRISDLSANLDRDGVTGSPVVPG
jgi:hypothetical protein